MNGRNLLNVPFAFALAATAFAVAPNAAAAADGPSAPAPASASATRAPAAGSNGAGPRAQSPDAPAGADAPVGGGLTKENDVPGVSLSGGGESGPRKDEVKVDTTKSDDEQENKNPFTGSIFFWDHSMSTQTARLETNAQQSFQPVYEWWFSLQPRYYFNKHLSYRVRADYTKEMTNSQDTTYYREGVFGDLWNTLRYEHHVSEKLKNTSVSASGTIKLPLSKESQAQGVYFKPSVGVGISQKIVINGESAKWFPNAGVSGGISYEKPIVGSTTPTGAGFTTFRQDTDGRSLSTDQLNGGLLKNHTLLGSVRGDVQITEKWGASLSVILINNWLYAPKSDVTVRTDTGQVAVPRDGNASTFTQASWIILGTDYDITDEVSLGVGYYNLAGILASDGQSRGIVGSDNIWWSPSARVFGTITANLGNIYERAAGIKKKDKKAAAAPLSPLAATSSATAN